MYIMVSVLTRAQFLLRVGVLLQEKYLQLPGIENYTNVNYYPCFPFSHDFFLPGFIFSLFACFLCAHIRFSDEREVDCEFQA